MMHKVQSSDPDVRVEIIPGVTSISACTATTGVPLVQAGERLAVLPATYDPEGVREVLQKFETVVLMKVNRVAEQVTAILDELGLKKQAIFVSRATTGEQEFVRDLDCLKGKTLDYHSMIIVKKGG